MVVSMLVHMSMFTAVAELMVAVLEIVQGMVGMGFMLGDVVVVMGVGGNFWIHLVMVANMGMVMSMSMSMMTMDSMGMGS